MRERGALWFLQVSMIPRAATRRCAPFGSQLDRGILLCSEVQSAVEDAAVPDDLVDHVR